MPRWLAHGLSGAFHPLLVPSYLVAALLWGAPSAFTLPATARPTVLAVVAISTFLLPALGTYALVRAGRVASLLLPDHRERSGPLLLALAGFVGAARLLWDVTPVLGLALALQAVAVALTWGISRYWLISAHGVAMGGTVGLALLLGRLVPGSNAWPLASTLVLAGAVGAARLALDAHTEAQVWAGLALGLGVGVGAAVVL
ncbi:MAG: hypothetical protein H7330_16865 [Hymenobacteraceae bacterium]|nr:hypothetical protein [Hymenobacteraceae bacterium]